MSKIRWDRKSSDEYRAVINGHECSVKFDAPNGLWVATAAKEFIGASPILIDAQRMCVKLIEKKGVNE